jgi:hypothetical protein
MIERMGVILVKTYHDHIEIALTRTKKGSPRFFMTEVTPDNRYPFEKAVGGTKGVDPKAVIPNLILLNNTFTSEFHFIFQNAGEIELSSDSEWVSVDAWSEAPWALRWHSFIKEAYAVLSAYNDNYAISVINPILVQQRSEMASHAREMVVAARRSDLIFGVTVNLMMQNLPNNIEWYHKHRIDWLLKTEHPRAVFIYKTSCLAVKRYTFLSTLHMLDHNEWWFWGVSTKLIECQEEHKELFNKNCYVFEAKAWQGIAMRLLNVNPQVSTQDHNEAIHSHFVEMNHPITRVNLAIPPKNLNESCQ